MVIPKQEEVMARGRRTGWEERVRLSPFRGLEAHRPLGSVNRLRGYDYKRSWGQRAELNGIDNVNARSSDETP